MEYQGEERRSNNCPCKHVTELIARRDGDMQLISQEINHTKEITKKEVESLLIDFKDINLQVKECLLSIQQSTLEFKENNHKLLDLSGRIRVIENQNKEIEKVIKEPLPVYINKWVGRQKYIYVWAGFISLVVLVSEHAEKAFKILTHLNVF